MTLSPLHRSWCVVSAYTWLALWTLSPLPLTCSSSCCWWERTLDCLYDSLSSLHCSWCVVRAYTLIVSMSRLLLSTCSWCVVSAYTWLASLCLLSPLSTCNLCGGERIHLIGFYDSRSAPPVAGVWWEHTLDWLYDSLSLSTCSWCVVSAYTWLALWFSLLSTCSWCVVSAYTWLALWLSLLSTCSWCVVSAYTWLSLWLSLLSTCSWCVVSALVPLSCGSRRIIQVDAAHWCWLRRTPPPHDCTALWVYNNTQ